MGSQANESKQAKGLQAYIDKRNRVWAQVRTENATLTQAQIEARLEQFGV